MTEQNPAGSIPRSTHHFLLLCILSVVLFVGWAATTSLEVVSGAQGEVVPSSQLKNVQHLEGGIVSDIKVVEGEQVTEGQALVLLEPMQDVANVDEMNTRLLSLRSKIVRLDAEVNGRSQLDFDDEFAQHDQLIQEARALFDTRKQRLDSQLALQRNVILQQQYEIEETQARLAANGTSLELLQEQTRISKELMEHSLVNRMSHIELLKNLADVEGQLKEDRARIQRMNAAVDEAKSHLELVRTTFLEEARQALEQATHDEKILRQRLLKSEDNLRRTTLRAPTSGIIKNLYVSTLGGILPPGGTVADIVPADDELIIEGRLPPSEIGYVQPGQASMIRLASADGARFGHINGVVKSISPDTLLSDDGHPYYKIRIIAQKKYFQYRGRDYALFPGMLVQCDIITGTRTILDYLLEPFTHSMSLALRER